MRRLHCVFQDGLILGIWICPDERFYYHIAEADATEPLTKEEIWEMLDYAVHSIRELVQSTISGI